MKAPRLMLSLIPAAVISVIAVPASSYQEAEVTDGGTIEGKIVYQGSVPMRKIIPTKDTEVCGDIREEPQVRVGPDKGVQDAVVYLEEIEQGKAWPEQQEAPVLDNKDCRFEPHVQVIPSGSLGVHNSDPVLHNTHGFYGRRTAFNIALPNQGQTIDVELRRPGEVRIECDAHGWMLGWVYVLDHPYHAVTGEDGTFTISDVPPGEYTLIANQEYTGPTEAPVKVTAGQATEVSIELKKN